MSSTELKLLYFFKIHKHLAFKKGEVIVRPNDRLNTIFYVKKGFVRAYAFSNDGKEATLFIFKPGSFFPLLLSLNEVSNKYYFEAATPVEIYSAPHTDTLGFIIKHHDVFFEFTHRLSLSIHNLFTRIETLTYKSVDIQLASLLLYLRDSNELIIPLSHNDLASWIGLNRETVSRHLKRFQKRNLIGYNGRKTIIIKDIAALEKEASGKL